jgi:5'-3' exonuclease
MRYLIIDTSYFVFFRFYALISYLKLSNKNFCNENFTIDNEFITRFSNLFEKSIISLLKRHFEITRKKFVNITVIFAIDCCRSDIWRLQLFSEYKANRDVIRTNDLFDARIFEHVYNVLIPSLIRKYSFFRQICNSNAEADDVVAISVRCLNEEPGFQNEKCVVITNDNDYLQLLDQVHSIYNLQGHDLSSKSVGGCAKKNMLYKVLIGDPSDNIKGILTRSIVNKLLSKHDDVESIEREFKELATEEQLRAFYMNKSLISFDHIPENICCSVKNTFYNQILRSSVA